MTPTSLSKFTATRSGVAIAKRAVADLADALGLPLPLEARPGADLWVRVERGEPLPEPSPLLRTADGWVQPGPPTVWSDFVAMVMTLGAPAPSSGEPFPDLSSLAAEVVDTEAGAWHLPAVAVRATPAAAPRIPAPHVPADVRGARVVVLASAWAAPLAGLTLATLGADVVRVDDPRRSDPFPLAGRLRRGQERIPLDLGSGDDRDRFAALLGSADLLIDGHPPRVRDNVRLGDDDLAAGLPGLAVLRIAAFAADDRPGYGPAAEARGGWATRQHPPRLGRSSVADPVAGLLGALAAAELLTEGGAGLRARVSLESAVGHLLAREARDG